MKDLLRRYYNEIYIPGEVYELNAEIVLMDERISREMPKNLGFKVAGTVGILIKAAKEGLLDLRESLDDLGNKGFWLSDDVYELALKMVEDNQN